MSIIQLVSNLNYGDAIGNDVIAIHHVLTQAGHHARIMTLEKHPAITTVTEPVDVSAVSPEDLVIFHKASGDELSGLFAALPCRKAILYHNITPARFFLPYDPVMSLNLFRGRRQLRRLAACRPWSWGDSDYNCEELRRCGFPEDRIRRLPILFDGTPADAPADEEVLRRLRGCPGTKMLFTGRIAPNKKQEDVIKVFATYRATVDPRAQLFLMGSWQGNDKYYAKLQGFIADLGLEGVTFTGHVSDEARNAYYKGCDVFVCMSEHEGFCVPLLEAMQHDVPVVAYASSAVPETLGDRSLLFEEKDYPAICRRIHRLQTDAADRAQVLAAQRESLARFDPTTVAARLLELVDEALKGGVTP